MSFIMSVINLMTDLFDFSWIRKLTNFFDGFVQDIAWLYNIFPTWLQFFIATILLAMIIIAVLRVIKEVVPFAG